MRWIFVQLKWRKKNETQPNENSSKTTTKLRIDRDFVNFLYKCEAIDRNGARPSLGPHLVMLLT